MSVPSYVLGGFALVTWLVLLPFSWWSQQRVPRKAGFAKSSLWEEDYPHLTADGRFAISAKQSKTSRQLMYDGIVLREVPTGKIYWQFNTGPFKYFDTMSPDGKFLVVLTHERMNEPVANVFDIDERRQVGKCKLEPLFASLAVSPGGTTLALGDFRGEEKQVILYDVQSRERKVIEHSCFEILFSPEGSRLAISDAKGISIFDVKTGKELPSFALPSSLREVAFSADGQTIFAVHDDGALRVWDIRTRSDRVLLRRSERTNFVRVSADGKALAVGYLIPAKVEGRFDDLGETIVLDTETGRQLASFHGCEDAAFGSDGKTLVTAHEDRTLNYLNLWDIPPRARFHWSWTVLLAVVAIGLTAASWWMRRAQRTD
jgi:WD40 repeat protein